MEHVYDSSRRATFFDGMARTFDLFGAMRKVRSTEGDPFASDLKALQSDWVEVGQSLEKAMKEYEEKKE